MSRPLGLFSHYLASRLLLQVKSGVITFGKINMHTTPLPDLLLALEGA